MQRLLRAWAAHQSEVPPCSLRQLRSGSPAPGGSTLITSAPNSARMRAANGPAISVPSSTTRRSERACCAVGGEAPKGLLEYHDLRPGPDDNSTGPNAAQSSAPRRTGLRRRRRGRERGRRRRRRRGRGQIRSPTQSREHPDDTGEEVVAALLCRGIDNLQHEQRVQHSRALHRRPASDGVGTCGICLPGTASRLSNVEGYRTCCAAQLIKQRGVPSWNLFGSSSGQSKELDRTAVHVELLNWPLLLPKRFQERTPRCLISCAAQQVR